MSTDIICGPTLLADSDVATLDAALIVRGAGLVGVRASTLFAFVLALSRVENLAWGRVERLG